MRKWILILGIVVLMSSYIVVFFINKSKDKEVKKEVTTNFPLSEETMETTTQKNSDVVVRKDPEVIAAVKTTMQSTVPGVAIDDAAIVSGEYALQRWHEENMGGEAVLHFEKGKGWVVLYEGGGGSSVESLVSVGVPEDIARKLVEAQ